jgi:transcriptional regulator with XRE-family HTH domain
MEIRIFPCLKCIRGMSKLAELRQMHNLTQEELAEKAHVSVRTIQRIEAGTAPKGYTLKVLAGALQVEEKELSGKPAHSEQPAATAVLKLINLSSLPFIILPPLNIIAPLALMFRKKQFSTPARELVTLQVVWTIGSAVFFLLCIFLKKWFSLGKDCIPIVMGILVVADVFIILRNAAEIGKNGSLFIRLNFSFL